MRSFRKALEQEEIVAPVNELAEGQDAVDVQILEDQAAISDATNEVADVVETGSIIDTTEIIEDTVQKSVDEGTGVDEVTAEVMTSSLEHFYDRLSFNGDKLFSISTESFSVAADRLEKTKVALEELKEFNKFAIAKNNVAQEGMFARLGNTVKLLFNSQEKIQDKLAIAIKASQVNGTKEGRIDEPGWGRSFAIVGNKELSGADVISYMENFNKVVLSPKLAEIVDEYVSIVDKISSELSKSRFIANETAVVEIQKLSDGLNQYENKVSDFVQKNGVKSAKNDPSFKMLTKQEAAKLGKATSDLINNKSVDAMIKKVDRAISVANTQIFDEGNTRLAGMMAKDMRAARAIINKLNPIMYEFFHILDVRNRVCFAAYQYINASALK